MIDADLQDPPELITAMVEHWRAGSDVVSATRTDRNGESRFKRWTAAGFYRLMNRVGDVPLGQNSGDSGCSTAAGDESKLTVRRLGGGTSDRSSSAIRAGRGSSCSTPCGTRSRRQAGGC